MAERVIEHKWFWAWQDDKEEHWLEEMSERGLHLVSPGYFGRYEFDKGQPQKYFYRLDFIAQNQNREDYYQLFSDACWEHIGEFGGWQYFRKLDDGQGDSEIFTDVTSKIEKYRRVLLFLVILTPIYLLPLNIRNMTEGNPSWIVIVMFVIWWGILSLMTFSIIKMIQRINALKNTLKQ